MRAGRQAELARPDVVGHRGDCDPGNDPRNQKACVKCGRIIPPPPSVVADLCDPAFESEATLTAARQAGVDGRALDAFAQARKQPGPVINHATRDFWQEDAEELADARNYTVWWLEQARADGTLTTERQWHLMQALGGIAFVWHHLQQAAR